MNAADEERLRSWAIEIVEALIEGVRWRQEGDERRAVGQGGLTISSRSGCWFSHSLGRGHWSAIPLIELLRKCSRTEALAWGSSWLQAHPGTGFLADAGADDDDAVSGRAAYARELMNHAIDPAGTAAEDYLRGRGIHGALPPCIRFVPDARIGEGALVGILTSHGRVVGLQLTYIDAFAGKSTVLPVRRRFMLEGARDAVFEAPAPSGAMYTIVCEGVEDAMSVAELGFPARIVGLPGIGTLAHLSVKKGEIIIVVRDGDELDSPADRALAGGVDALLLQGALDVMVTETPLGEDANSILQRDGIEGLTALLGDTYKAELSRDGEITRLSRLDPLDYDAERKTAAEFLGIRLSTLDAEVGRLRGTKAAAAGPGANADDVDDIELLEDPVDLRETLDEILVELKRYIVAEEAAMAAVALWCAHTHLCHHDHIRLQRSARLAIQARTPGAGKTTLLEAIGALVPRPRMAASLTASSVLRVTDQLRPCLLIDEADRVLRDRNSDLLAILNSGDRRASSWVERSVPTADGGWAVQRFSVWGAVAFSGIDELPPTLQDRSILIQMQRALDRDVPGHLEDGSSDELMLLRRKLATWAHELEELPRPTMPDLLTRQAGRTGDNWRTLFGIAQLAGGRWPELVEQAALAAVQREGQMTLVQRLLESVWRIFEKRSTDASIPKDDDKIRIPTPDLIQALLADDAEEWGTTNRGRAVTDYWLRDNLRHLLVPPGSQEWEGPARGGQRGKRYRGYHRWQFEKAWERYLRSSFFVYPSKTSEGSAGSMEDEEYQGDSEDMASAGEAGIHGNGADDEPTADPAACRTSKNSENSIKSTTSADTVDPSDISNRYGEEQQPNGLDLEIAVFGAANPKWSTLRIAKKFGQPRDHVARLLGRDR